MDPHRSHVYSKTCREAGQLKAFYFALASSKRGVAVGRSFRTVSDIRSDLAKTGRAD